MEEELAAPGRPREHSYLPFNVAGAVAVFLIENLERAPPNPGDEADAEYIVVDRGIIGRAADP